MSSLAAARAEDFRPPWFRALPASVGPVLVGLAAAYALQAWIKPHLGEYPAKVLLDIGINVILAVSLNIVNGFTGQFSIGHAGFMALGGYAAGAITYYGSYRLWDSAQFHGGFLSWGKDNALFEGSLVASGDALFLAGCLAGGLVAAIAGYIVGLPSLRLRGDYLAIVTLGFGEIVRVLLQRTDDVLYTAAEVREASLLTLATAVGGPLGFGGLPVYTSLFWAYAFVAITLLVAFRIKESTHGRAFLSIREDEIAAEAMGVFTTRYKVRAFVIAAFFAGIAGGLFAHEIGTTLNPRELGFQKSFDIVIMVVLGGMGSISGATLAAVILTVVPEFLREPFPIWMYSLVLAALVLVIRRRSGLRPAAWILGLTAMFEITRESAGYVGINLADLRMIIYALVLIVMMIVRPQGLFGLHEVWDLFRRRGVRS